MYPLEQILAIKIIRDERRLDPAEAQGKNSVRAALKRLSLIDKSPCLA
jgi:hypothetical protein